MTILIDMDDTIECLLEEWVAALNEEHGTNVDPQEITDWDMHKAFPKLSRHQVYEPLHDYYFWERVPPKPGAVENVQRLINDGHDVYLCTSTDYRNVEPKFVFIIERYFPFISWDHVIVAHKKQMIRGDIIIDDGPHNCIGGDYFGILMDAPHNKKIDVSEHDRLVRVHDWEEAYKMVQKVAKTLENGELGVANQ